MNDMQKVAFDPFSAEFLNEPYSRLGQMRDAGEAVWLDKYQACAFTRHEQVQSLLTDSVRMISHSGPKNLSQDGYWQPSPFLEGDPASHGRVCAAVAAVLSRATLNRLYHGFSEDAEALVEQLVERRSFDAIADLALTFPLKAISDAVGLTAIGRDNLIIYGNMAFDALGPRNALPNCFAEGVEGACRWMKTQCLSAALAGKGLGAALYAQADAGACTEVEAGLAIRCLLAAGITTTVNAIGNGVASLVRNPGQWRHLHADPSLARAALEESLRFESPVQTCYQTTMRDIPLAKTRLPQGSMVFLFLGAANRDHRRWDRADQFDIRRNTTGHVSFGTGVLACVGQKITKLAGEILFAALARRVAAWEFVGDPILHLNNTVRGWSSLPVKVSTATHKTRPALWGLPGRKFDPKIQDRP